MHGAPIYFQFTDKKAAYQAYDTLLELDYHTKFMDHPHPEHMPTLQVFVERGDLTSALEIAQAHGGAVLEAYDSPKEPALFSSAYGLEEGLSVPAHVVNEDMAESYLTGNVSAPQEDEFEPSGDGYDHFPAGIRL